MKRILKPALVALLALASIVCIPQAQAAEEKEKAAVHTKTLWEQIYEGGWVMIPIGICSVLTVYLCGDGWMKTGRKRTSPPVYETEIKRLFREGDYVGAYNFSKENPSPFTNVMKAGVGMLGEGKSAVEEAMVAAMHQESSKLNTYISYLSVIGVCTPMIGLLGTVTGMIKAFANLGTSGIGDPSGLSAAIGEVLIATASGLLIAIPAFGMFYFLRSRSNESMHHIQDLLQDLFRKMPYEHMAGLHISGEEIFAATPNWVEVVHEEHAEGNADGHAEAPAH
ncbi:MAG: MotA/TolQ/ExbB proton channel family protein [Verrucomicrobiota bacterium]